MVVRELEHLPSCGASTDDIANHRANSVESDFILDRSISHRKDADIEWHAICTLSQCESR